MREEMMREEMLLPQEFHVSCAFLMDKSGSMAGEKIQSLMDGDWFAD